MHDWPCASASATQHRPHQRMFAARAFLTPYTRGKTLGARREPHHQNSFCRASQCCCLPSSSRRTSYTSFALAPHTRHARHPRDAACATPRDAACATSARRCMRDMCATRQARHQRLSLWTPGPRARPRALLVSGAQVARVGRAGARGLDKFVRLERVARGQSRVRATSVVTQRCIATAPTFWLTTTTTPARHFHGRGRQTAQANAAARPSAAPRRAPQRGLALQRKGRPAAGAASRAR
jgi:hypothetical protein